MAERRWTAIHSIIIYHVAVTSLSHGSRSHVYDSPLMQYCHPSVPYPFPGLFSVRPRKHMGSLDLAQCSPM